jgi:cytochrome c5
MKIQHNTLALLAVISVCIGLVILGCVTTSQAVKDQSPQAVFETTCAKCHDTDRALDKAKTAAEWRETVKRMQGKPFSGISNEQAEIIISYLSEARGK